MIRFTTTRCPLGRLLLAGSKDGICLVYFGDSDAQLKAELANTFPSAVLRRDDAELHAWMSTLLNHLNGRQPYLDLPLDVRPTAFQKRVWQQLCAIPYGSTRSYRDIACALGRPTAVRAVARACAANPVSLIIPCHRVVRADGQLGGYRWGLERKRALLAQEAVLRASCVTGAPSARGEHVGESH
jgi:O-6-methylguanine DNA methyltransferase